MTLAYSAANPVFLLVAAVSLYLAIGLAFAIPFVFLGISKIDPAAKTAPTLARLILIPGAIATWPLMLVKWLKATKHPEQTQ